MYLLRNISFIIAMLAMISGIARAADELRAGVAVVDITPPVPFRMSGYFHERVSTGVKDPLHAKAVVIQQGGEAAALVFCDLIGIPLDVSTRSRQKASDATGIPAEHIAVAATHSHTGPLYFGALRKHFHDRSVARLGKDPYEVVDYPAELVDHIAAAIVKAQSELQPVRLEAGYANEDRLPFNRRFLMRDGSVRFNPGQLNPDIIRAVGPADPQIGIVTLKRRDTSAPLAAVVAFALHLDTTGDTEYSADFPKFTEDRLKESHGPEFTLLFGAGTCGDINHIDVTTREKRSANEIGDMLAEAVGQAIQTDALTTIEKPSLAVRSTKINVPLQQYTEAETADARAKMALIGGRELPFLEQVKASKIMAIELRGGETMSLEVQAFRLGDETAIVTLPGEVFVELGLAIKAASPFNTTLVMELANDALGYIPTQKAFVEGSYETVNSVVQPGSGEKLVEAAIGLLKELE